MNNEKYKEREKTCFIDKLYFACFIDNAQSKGTLSNRKFRFSFACNAKICINVLFGLIFIRFALLVFLKIVLAAAYVTISHFDYYVVIKFFLFNEVACEHNLQDVVQSELLRLPVYRRCSKSDCRKCAHQQSIFDMRTYLENLHPTATAVVSGARRECVFANSSLGTLLARSFPMSFHEFTVWNAPNMSEQ